MKLHLLAAIMVAVGVPAIRPALAGNLVINGDFTAVGTIFPWSFVAPYSGASGVGGGDPPPEGNSFVFAAQSPVSDTIEQSLSTTPGQSYTIDFLLAHPSSGTYSFSGDFNGTSFISLGPSTGTFAYTDYSITELATSSATTLAFTGSVLGIHGLYLAKVSVTAAPEPSTMVLAGLAAAGLAVMKLRRRRHSRP